MTLIYVGIALVVVAIALCIFAHYCLAQGIAALCCCCGSLVCCGRRKQEPLMAGHVASDARGSYLPPPMPAVQLQPQQQLGYPAQISGNKM